MNGSDVETRSLALSSDEQRALDLFDTLQRLRLEIAIVKALQTGNGHGSRQVCRHAYAAAPGASGVSETSRDDLLEARAKLELRNDAIEAVMMANPILKAVHHGTDASPVEWHVDEAAVAVAGQASDMETIRSQLTSVHVETARAARHNVELTTELCELADQLQRKQVGSNINSPGTRDAIEQLKQQVASRRKRWRAIKGVASGVVCGSGIDWADDDNLCDMVLDPEDEDERL
ncbi:hypothetical protein L249_5878 [Ophiocordyceps polyrhachis-furcata BCC 54312]|uniref:Centromere protein H C-terminal domain-containing protein n=1 Tax=Ophiocordyceps polyrhachis-furcata BCC 54312 TaxID=1330021 RepID=A0A367L0E1_9HYPO|nr:hypothetical protein L249_5878 [Ophiocordyceps polyrhachis-furcata BCC 54312]